MRNGILFIITLVILDSQICLSQVKHTSPVDFFKEDITLAVSDSSARISGIYYFRHNTEHDTRMPVVFPFYVDSLNPYPDSIAAYMVNGADTIRLDFRNQRERGAIWLAIPLFSNNVTVWHLDYRQKIRDTRAVYILTSTAAWGKPLEDATYKFIVPLSFADVRTWPEADTVLAEGNFREYLAHRTNFMPGQNMEVKWVSK